MLPLVLRPWCEKAVPPLTGVQLLKNQYRFVSAMNGGAICLIYIVWVALGPPVALCVVVKVGH